MYFWFSTRLSMSLLLSKSSTIVALAHLIYLYWVLLFLDYSTKTVLAVSSCEASQQMYTSPSQIIQLCVSMPLPKTQSLLYPKEHPPHSIILLCFIYFSYPLLLHDFISVHCLISHGNVSSVNAGISFACSLLCMEHGWNSINICPVNKWLCITAYLDLHVHMCFHI